MEVISGKTIADEIQTEIREANARDGLSPCLAIVDVGENKENTLYIGLKRKAVEAIGGRAIVVKLSQDSSRELILEQINNLNQDLNVHGILLQLPLPAPLEPYREDFLESIRPQKDVDGFCPHNRGLLMGSEPHFISCAALACIEITRKLMSPLQGKRVLLVGNSFDLIQPLALLFIKAASQVSIIPAYQPEAMAEADIAIIEYGDPLMVKDTGIKKPLLLIDAGFHWYHEKVCGNVDREAVAGLDGYLLPVPGGMGPILIAELMMNLSKAARRELKEP